MDKLYTIQEIATKLNLSDKTLRRWEEAGRFTPSRTLGNQRRYSIEDLQILDALKHGTILKQSDLLNLEQAALLCGVSSTTLIRWENDGKIHPFITAGNTYYPRQKLMEKLDELKCPRGPDLPAQADPFEGTVPERNSRLQAEKGPPPRRGGTVPTGYLTHILITLLLLFSYHLIFNMKPTKLDSPTPSSTTTISDPTIDLLKTMLAPTGALTTTSLTLHSSFAPTTPVSGTIYFDNLSSSLKIYKGNAWSDLAGTTTTLKVNDATLIMSSATLPKGKNQTSVTHDQLTPTTPVTVTFTSDYAPAKKYWVTVGQGSFTIHTDFPVSSDVPFNYDFLAPPVSSESAVPTF